MRLIVVRHGETEWNVQKKTQGTTDIKLSERGAQQAKQIAQRLANMKVDRVVTSPLLRAYETARIIALPNRLPLAIENDLVEIRFGKWEGLTFDEIGEQYPKELAIWSETPHACIIPQAELVNDVLKRVDNFLNRMTTLYRNETIVAVTHSLPSKLIIARSIGLPPDNFHSLRIDNASMSIVDFYLERSVLRLFNDTTHLQEGVKWQ